MRSPLYSLCLFGLQLLAWLAIPDGVWLADSDKMTTQTDSTDVSWEFIVGSHFTGSDYDTAMSIISCESGFDTHADNPTSSALGGWQFLAGTWEWVRGDSDLDLDPYPAGPVDPWQATAAAAWLRDEAGWSQWSCYGVRSRDWAEPVTVDLVSSDGPRVRP